MGMEKPPNKNIERWVDCPDCKGKGKTDGETCSRCKGKGKIIDRH